MLAGEHRHHERFERLVSVATGSAPAGHLGEPVPPHPEPGEPAELLEQIRRCPGVERADTAALHTLVKEVPLGRGDPLWRLLVALMQLDTEEHLKMWHHLGAELFAHEQREPR